ncbi:hypothetical protein U6B65_03360 [Oscillospiraceae bacterium MB08-C2-2]|nr:hypothetical protein U6B65_03360 [Oscillospiraceae bacterium MB08-C2-2]
MFLYHKISGWFSDLHWYAKFSFRLGFGVMCCYYAVALTAYLITPIAVNYLAALAIQDGALEAAPASLVVGICAGIICDVTYKRSQPKSH